MLKAPKPRLCFDRCVFDADYSPLTPQELAATGQALYGPGWRAALAHAFAVTEAEIVAVESGQAPAPEEWRVQLIGLAQELALRALEAANNLLWRHLGAEETVQQPLYAPQPPRFA